MTKVGLCTPHGYETRFIRHREGGITALVPARMAATHFEASTSRTGGSPAGHSDVTRQSGERARTRGFSHWSRAPVLIPQCKDAERGEAEQLRLNIHAWRNRPDPLIGVVDATTSCKSRLEGVWRLIRNEE